MDVWGLASALSEAVKKTSKDFVETVRNTEWKNELEDIRKELEEDTSEITNNAKTFTEKLNKETAKVVEKTGIVEAVGLWERDEPHGSSEKKIWISEAADAKVHELGKRIVEGTSQTYDTIAKAFQNELGLEHGHDHNINHDGGNHAQGRLLAAREVLEKDKDTYMLDPEDSASFTRWKQQAHNVPESRILSAMLGESQNLQAMYDLLVPEMVSDEEFWKRYLFKLHCLEEKQVRLAQAAVRSSNLESNEVDWDDAWEEHSDQHEHDSVEDRETSDSHRENIHTGMANVEQTCDPCHGRQGAAGKEQSFVSDTISNLAECEEDLSPDSAKGVPQLTGEKETLEGVPANGIDENVSEQDTRSESSYDDVTNWE